MSEKYRKNIERIVSVVEGKYQNKINPDLYLKMFTQAER